MPERRRHLSAACSSGTTYLVRFVLLDLSAWDSSTTTALNMPGRRRSDSMRFTTRLMEQMTTRVEPSRFRIVPFPDVMTLIWSFRRIVVFSSPPALEVVSSTLEAASSSSSAFSSSSGRHSSFLPSSSSSSPPPPPPLMAQPPSSFRDSLPIQWRSSISQWYLAVLGQRTSSGQSSMKADMAAMAWTLEQPRNQISCECSFE